MTQVASEVAGTQLALTDKGYVYLLSDKDKTLAKFTQLGGYGAGQYVKASECADGIPFVLPLKDRTTVQVDESSIREAAATNAVATMTMYKLLILTEREQSVTSHKVSYHKVSRLADGQVEAGSDGFSVEATQEMKFRMLQQGASLEANKIVCKNMFAKCRLAAIDQSPFVSNVFRFRFERVGLSLKVQKPYIVTMRSISLEKGKPFRVVGES